jgi:hypothetical protein
MRDSVSKSSNTIVCLKPHSCCLTLPPRLHRNCLSNSPPLIQSYPALENKSLNTAAYVFHRPTSSIEPPLFLLQYTVSSWLVVGSQKCARRQRILTTPQTATANTSSLSVAPELNLERGGCQPVGADR